jgi:hypothetical protein
MNNPNRRTKGILKATAFLMLLMAGTSLFAQQSFNTTIYFDYTYFLSNKGPKTAPTAGVTGFKDNYFAFRRAYFTYENKISDNLKFRFRVDADTVSALDKSAKPDDKTRPFIKHIYMEWSNILPKSILKVGMADTLTFKAAEDQWGYRSVAKTLLDNFKDVTAKDIKASSADLGASFTGSISKELRYGVMVVNGAGYSHPEGNKYKKVEAQVQVIPVAGLSFVGYMDTEKQGGGADAQTYKLDAYMNMIKGVTLGGEYFSYKNDTYKLDNGSRYDVKGFSVFGRTVLVRDRLNAFARFDNYEPNSRTGNDKTSLVIAGLDWAPVHSSFKLQPNVWFYSYEDSAKKDDVIFNMTFFLSF